MINIIIPAYNAHKTIKRAIDSVLSQSYQDYDITIVNDGGEPYNITNIDFLTELNYGENKGPGYARNYGIDHTDGDFILFIDADDYLLPDALQNLIDTVKDDTGFVIGGIEAENEDGTTRLIKNNGNFMHGKLYRRAYIEELGIRSNETRCCEDDSFNSLCLLCLDGKKYKEYSTEKPVYRWTYTEGSLGRSNIDDWEHKIVPVAMVDNKIYVYNELKKRGITSGRILLDKVRFFLHCTINYIRDNHNFPQYEESNWANLNRSYKEVYREIEGQVTDEIFNYALKLFNVEFTDNDIDYIKKIIDKVRKPYLTGKIDVIIPCHNSHKTLDRCLGSILSQKNLEDLEVTLVRDGGEGYKEFIDRYSSIMNIKEIGYDKNSGPAKARNFGMDNTDNEFILFVDSDDVLANAYATTVLKTEMEHNPTNVICIGSFIEEVVNYQFKPHNHDTSFVHGKLYKRAFLEKHDVRFNEETRANEDVGFNILALLSADAKLDNIHYTDFTVAFWVFNGDSIARADKTTYEHSTSFRGFADNLRYVFECLDKKGRGLEPRIILEKATTMQRLYYLYNERTKDFPQYKEGNLQVVKHFYRNVYKHIEHLVNDELFNKVYSSLPFKGDEKTNKKAIRKFLKSL